MDDSHTITETFDEGIRIGVQELEQESLELTKIIGKILVNSKS